MILTPEQEFEKEMLKRHLADNPEQAAMMLWALFTKRVQEQQQHQQLEAQYDELLEKYINLYDAYLANLKLLSKNPGERAAKKNIQLSSFAQEKLK